MPSSYAGNDTTWAANVTMPDDADPKNAASVNVGFEPLADRTAYLRRLVEVDGVLAIRHGSASTMYGLAGAADGTLFLVDGWGLFRRDTASIAPVDGENVVAAIDGGRWIHKTRNMTVGSYGVKLGANFSTSSTDLVAVPGLSLSLAHLQAFDIVEFSGNVKLNTGVNSTATLLVAATDGTTPANFGGSFTVASASAHYPLSGRYVVTVSGTTTLGVQLAISTGTVGAVGASDFVSYLNARVIRP